MEDLTKMEETVLIAIWQLKNKAYGYEIRKHISEVFKKEFSLGNLYSALYQMNKKDYINKSIGEATERRRGKKKIYYSVTPKGMKALKLACEMHDLVWRGVTVHSFEFLGK